MGQAIGSIASREVGEPSQDVPSISLGMRHLGAPYSFLSRTGPGKEHGAMARTLRRRFTRSANVGGGSVGEFRTFHDGFRESRVRMDAFQNIPSDGPHFDR